MLLRSSALRRATSSFLSCEKDLEIIIKKIFVENPYSSTLKRLLVINNSDCLVTDNTDYNNIVAALSLNDLHNQGYIKIEPKLSFGLHEEVKAYIIIEFSNFTPNMNNPEFRDSILDFNIICHTDYWDLGDYRLRPIKIMGYIDAVLDGAKLAGIGTLQFLGANEIVLDENLSGYLLRYAAIHGSDDTIPIEE